MQSSTLLQIHSVARDVARTGGTVARRLFRSAGLAVDTKADESPVTMGDRNAEDAMRRMIHEAFPDHGILGEEHGAINADAEWQWLLDPIDGTKTYVRGVPLFTTLVGVLHREQPVAGVIFNPVTGEMASAASGLGAIDESGARISVSGTRDLSEAWVGMTDPADLERRRPGLLGAIAGTCRAIRTWADGYGYLLVARGNMDAMADPIVSPWDVGPLRVVISEAGGAFSSFDGSSEALPSSVVTSSSPELQAQLLSLIKETE